jgi:hypothetical protein
VLRANLTGILVVEAAHADVARNEVRGPEAPGGDNRSGIGFWTNTSGSIVGNVFEGYSGDSGPGCAISLAARAGQIEVSANRLAGTDNAAQICDARPGDGPAATPG